MKKYLTILLSLIITFSCIGCSLNNQNEYAIKIVVPAKSQDDFVFSHEEISPKADTITVIGDDTFPDTKVVLKTVQVKKKTAYQPSFMAHGKSVKMAVEKGGWFKIGLNIQNDTDKDKIYTLLIKPVEVRVEDKNNP